MQSTLSTPSMPSKTRPPSGGVAKATHEITFALIPSDDFGEIIDNASAKVAGSWLITVDGTWNVPTTL
jgi:hypothetical protein